MLTVSESGGTCVRNLQATEGDVCSHTEGDSLSDNNAGGHVRWAGGSRVSLGIRLRGSGTLNLIRT